MLGELDGQEDNIQIYVVPTSAGAYQVQEADTLGLIASWYNMTSIAATPSTFSNMYSMNFTASSQYAGACRVGVNYLSSYLLNKNATAGHGNIEQMNQTSKPTYIQYYQWTGSEVRQAFGSEANVTYSSGGKSGQIYGTGTASSPTINTFTDLVDPLGAFYLEDAGSDSLPIMRSSSMGTWSSPRAVTDMRRGSS